MEVDEDPLTDSSQNSNTAALTAADNPNYATSDPPDAGDGFNGTSVGYYTFDGTDIASVTNDASIRFGTQDFSLVVWFLGNGGGTSPSMMGLGSTGATEWMIRSDSNDYVSFYGSTGKILLVDDADTFDATWHHAAVTRDYDGNGYLYVDGELAATDASVNYDLSESSIDFEIGCAESANGRFWGGSLDEVALFTSILDQTDINDIMNNGLVQATSSGTTLYGVTLSGVTFN